MIDLIVSVADSYQENLMDGLLPRIPRSATTRNFSYKIVQNIGHDSGSYNDSHELLRPSINKYRYALVVFDFEGTGIEQSMTPEQAESNVERLLDRNGWPGRNSVIIVNPEIENWLWQDNPNIQRAIGWTHTLSLYTWARQNGKIRPNQVKPFRPKETFEEALRICRTSKSSSIYKKIASSVSYKGCTDPSFIKLIQQLSTWFPII